MTSAHTVPFRGRAARKSSVTLISSFESSVYKFLELRLLHQLQYIFSRIVVSISACHQTIRRRPGFNSQLESLHFELDFAVRGDSNNHRHLSNNHVDGCHSFWTFGLSLAFQDALQFFLDVGAVCKHQVMYQCMRTTTSTALIRVPYIWGNMLRYSTLLRSLFVAASGE
jgi:hypothetical protein